MPLQLAIERVAFDQNYEELLNSLEFILRQDPIVSRQPVFSRTPDNITKDVTFGDVKTKCTSALSGPLQHATQLDNLAVKDVSSYIFRREFITAIGRIIHQTQREIWHDVNDWDHHWSTKILAMVIQTLPLAARRREHEVSTE